MKKIIFAENFTTLEKSHFYSSLSFLTYRIFSIRKWKYKLKLENKFLDYFWAYDKKIVSFYNARTAIFQLLNNLWFKSKDEVIINSYNCISVVNSIIQSWLTPIYVEIDKENLWLDVDDLIKKIWPRTKAIIVQHTFWKPSNIKKIVNIAKENNILLIEDCAHSLWSKIYDKKLWLFWDFAIFSTWRDKVISGVNWGFLLINNEKYFKLKNKIEKKLKKLNINILLQNHLYNVLSFVWIKTYNFCSIWKTIIFLSKKFHLFNQVLDENEKKCENDKLYYSLPDSLAYIALDQLNKLFFIQKHRKSISIYYNENIDNKMLNILFKEQKQEDLNYFRYPILFKNAIDWESFYNYFKDKWIILWTSWTWSNIAPKTSNLEKSKYKWDCKLAEDLSKNIFFLPNSTNVSIKDAEKIVKLINNYNV